MKVCSECRTKKPITEFKGANYTVCKSCGQERLNKARREKKAKWRDYVDEKKGTSCSMCGYSLCPEALELHHVYPEQKTLSFYDFINNKPFTDENKAIMARELRNAIRLCNRCHKEIHSKGGTL